MLVSIVIPAHNAEKTLRQCIEACLGQTHREIEIVVVDDGSTDSSGDIVQNLSVRCIRQDQRGPAAARNAGAREALGEVIAFTDSDCVPEADWIERLLPAFEDSVSAVGGSYGIANPQHWLARMVHEEIRMRHVGLRGETDVLGSFNMAVKKEAFWAIKGFDENFTTASAEDNDMAYRLADAGWTLRFEPSAVVNHYHPTRLGAYLRTQMRHGFWRVKLYAKHPRHARRGDRYAGPADLLAPGIALIVVAALSCLPVAWFASSTVFFWATIPPVCACGVYLAIRLPTALRMAIRTRDVRMVEFGDVAFLRDVVRALGMIHGFWHFLIRRKATV